MTPTPPLRRLGELIGNPLATGGGAQFEARAATNTGSGR